VSVALLRSPDFVRLLAGWTVSRFGSLMGALQYTALVALEAGPWEMGVLTAMGAAPGLAAGLVAGVWVDRVRRRPVLIGVDAARALSLVALGALYVAGSLEIGHLFVVAAVHGVLGSVFEIAHPAYVPSLVGKDRLVEANSRLTAAESVVESVAFSIGGWVVQFLGSMVAVATNAATFLASALLLLSIRGREGRVLRSTAAPLGTPLGNGLREAGEGMRLLWSQPLLRALATAAVAQGLMYGMVGAVIFVFGLRDLGIPAGILGTIFAVGGISSALGASLVERLNRRFGMGPVMTAGFALFGLAGLLTPLAQGPLVLACAFLLGQQLLGDGSITAYEVNAMALRQSTVPDEMMGRVNAGLRFVSTGALLIGSFLGGALGEQAGLRPVMVLGASVGLAGAALLTMSPVRALRKLQ
jgi:MFS family permease